MVGRNGQGKSTLLKLVAGALEYEGHVRVHGGVARSSSHRGVRVI